MRPVKIFADSTIDLNKETYKEKDIVILPLEVNFGEESYLDGVNLEPDEIYKRVEKEKAKKSKVFPKTAACSEYRFYEAFKEWVEKGYDIVYAGIGSKMSATYQNAINASQEFKDHVYIIDSNNLSSGTGLLVLKMCKYRDEGKSAKEIYDLVSPLVDKLVVQFVLDTLEYTYKGGRCSGVTSIIGHILSIHPVIKMISGKMSIYKMKRGKHIVCCKALSEDLKNDYPNIDLDHIMVTHSGSPDLTIQTVKQLVVDVIGKENEDKIMVTRAGAVVSCHCGPNTIGILYIKN